MKKNLSLFFIGLFIISLIFSGCTKTKNNIVASTMEDTVAYEISNISGVNELSDEQIKALSVVVRSKLSSDENLNKKLIDSSKIDEWVQKLTKQTENEVIFNGSNLAEVDYSEANVDEVWHEEIKKSKILNYMMKKGINLSNVSDINYETNESGQLENIVVGGKTISYNELKQNFNLKSNKIVDVKNNVSSIELTGQNEYSENILYFNKLKEYKSENYREILNNYYNGYKIKTI